MGSDWPRLRRSAALDVFSKPQHGNGVWAPAIRYHNAEFYIFYGDPDFGIYMVKAKQAAGSWSAPLLITQAKGWIDPCPFWDDDGKAYLVSAMAASRSGIKSILIVSRMDPAGTKLLDEGTMVYDGHEQDPTVEGPKLYKRNSYYYVAAPAGGVRKGWQLALRSKNIYGPYERKVVLAQGNTSINGPHQGGWVDTPSGEFWFLHFQDKGVYGRVVHLQPMKWIDDWPMIGDNGRPVLTAKKPTAAKASPVMTPPDSDEFNAAGLGLQWQWHANPKPGWAFPAGGLGFLRLFCVTLPETFRNFWDVPNLLLQKFPALQFTATTKVTFTTRAVDEKTGLIVMGTDYAYVSVKKKPDGLYVSQTIVKNADRGGAEHESPATLLSSATFYLRVKVSSDGSCRFSYSSNGTDFTNIGERFDARPGRWIGAKVGLFAVRAGPASESGYAAVDWFRVE